MAAPRRNDFAITFLGHSRIDRDTRPGDHTLRREHVVRGTDHQLGAAAGLASLEVLQSPGSVRNRRALERALRNELQTLWSFANVGDIRQVGTIVGIELVKNWL